MVSVIIGHYQHLFLLDTNGVWTGSREVRPFPMPTKLHFDLDARILTAIDSAQKTSLEYVSWCVCVCVHACDV